jgi:hypothetical protein
MAFDPTCVIHSSCSWRPIQSSSSATFTGLTKKSWAGMPAGLSSPLS